MENIKLRVWNVEDKELEYINDFYWFEEQQVHNIANGIGKSSYRTYKFMQFIGLKDESEKEIFEGDVLDLYGTLYLVYWAEDTSCWALKSKNKDLFLFQVLTEETIIVGNIYENPELLKGDEINE